MHTCNSHCNNSGVSNVFTPSRQRRNDALTILYILSRNLRNKSWIHTNYLWKIQGIHHENNERIPQWRKRFYSYGTYSKGYNDRDIRLISGYFTSLTEDLGKK